MKVQLALPDVLGDHDDFCLARLNEPHRCPVLGPPLHRAIRDLAGGMPVLLVHRAGNGELRSFGLTVHHMAAVGIDLDAQCWVEFELDEGEGRPDGAHSASDLGQVA
jgi:hypothetical protein